MLRKATRVLMERVSVRAHLHDGMPTNCQTVRICSWFSASIRYLFFSQMRLPSASKFILERRLHYQQDLLVRAKKNQTEISLVSGEKFMGQMQI